ncbi:MAG TPA: hypothetical protein VH114_04940 [Candidatus Acidoferrum sp.]|nr:hypothetical protein [Candidatus Acidoferrum sp.]
MAKATITNDKGLKIVVEGSPEEVQNIIRQMGGGAGHSKQQAGSAAKAGKRLPSATDAILELNEEGFFNKPKALADIKQKLADQGMIYPLTTLSGVVLLLVRRRKLGRVKEDGRWSYVSR